MSGNKFKALGDTSYDYYELTKDLGYNNSGFGNRGYILPKGSVFVHDKFDNIHGSLGNGCLTLCWDKKGNSQGWICGECLHLHAIFKDTDLFEKIDSEKSKLREKILSLEKELNLVKQEFNKLEK